MHLIDISGTDEAGKPDTGSIDHIAFVSRGFEAMKQHLSQGGHEYEAREVPGGRLLQIFVRDPNGVLLELNYETKNER